MKFADLFPWKKKATKLDNANPDIGRPEITHEVIKGIITKKCVHCGKTYPLTEFRKNLSTSDGKGCACRICERTYKEWWRETTRAYKVTKLADIPAEVRPESPWKRKESVHAKATDDASNGADNSNGGSGTFND